MRPETQEWLDAHPAEAECLRLFTEMMADELAANDGKGNRPGWLTMTRKEAVAEVHWHASKLAVAAKFFDEQPGFKMHRAAVEEHAADVANCALMVVDCAGLLAPAPSTYPEGEGGNG